MINAEIKALHHSALLFFEKAEVKKVLLKWINKFAIQKDTAALKMGKLTCNTNQRNAVYKLPLEENNGIEYGFIENFCMLFH